MLVHTYIQDEQKYILYAATDHMYMDTVDVIRQVSTNLSPASVSQLICEIP